MADYTNVLSDRSWNDPNRTQEQNLAELSRRLEAEGYKPGTSEFDSAFYSIVNLVSSSTNSSLVGDPYASETGNLALKNWMAENFTQEMASKIGVDVAAMTGFSPESGGYYAPGTGEFIPPNDPWQRNPDGSKLLFEGQPITSREWSVREFYRQQYGRQPTTEEIADGVAGLDTPQGYRRFFINQYGREPNADELAQGLGTGKYAMTGTSSSTGTSSGTSTSGTLGLTADQAKSLGAFQIFRGFLDQYGLGALAADVEKYKLDGLSDDELLIRLRTESEAYKKRFAANEQRLKNGLTALSEAEYINLEDQYQDVMRRYGLPETYYTRGDMGRQEGFEKFIGGDVSPVELEDRIQLAQNRVLYAAPEVSKALREFYPDITNGDILAYALDPSKAIENIKRKVTAAEIGAGAMQSGLTTGLARAEELQRYGVTGDQARQGYQTIGSLLPRATTLGDIYSKQGLGAYTQTTAESEVFGTPGAIEAEKKRRQLAQLESAAFSGSSGAAGSALARERAGQF